MFEWWESLGSCAPFVTVETMVAISEKRTTPIDLRSPLQQFIGRKCSDEVAKQTEEDLQKVQQLRNEVVETRSASLESRRDLLERYFRALIIMEPRFPISSEKEHVNNLAFTWSDVFKPGKKATQRNISFEKASIMFNLAAVQSRIALSADRATASGLKQACNCFQAAAGAFKFLRDNISEQASGSASILDISVECAGALEQLMLAQAQECFFEKVIGDQKPNLLCGKVARQVGLFYQEAYEALSVPPLNQYIDPTLVAHAQLKAAQYQGEACYRVALDLRDKDEVGEEIARLQVANGIISAAKRSAKGVVGPLCDAVSKLEANVNLNLERAVKENERVYLMRVTPLDSLPPIPAASLVKSLPMEDVVDVSNEKLFPSIIPDSWARALSKYDEMVDAITKFQLEKLQEESYVIRAQLKAMQLPDSINALLEGGANFPEDLKNDVEAVQSDGGRSGLEAQMKELHDLRRASENLLEQEEKSLHKASTENTEESFPQLFVRWFKLHSSKQAEDPRERWISLAVKLKQAADSLPKIEQTIKDNWAFLAILDVKPIEEALSMPSKGDPVVGNLKQSLEQLEILGSQSVELKDRLTDMKRKDNILPKLMSNSGSHESLLEKELAKYDPLCQEVNKNVEAQEKLLQQIKIQNDVLAAGFNLDEFVALQGRIYKQIDGAISKYREIRDKMKSVRFELYFILEDMRRNK